ncbi:NUDIX domain-containing protein [Actinomadura hibisca]|uniref:NUDIX domain-containing protein n=1 Tax=Actinomadura hibisca TaxID=68565 RepID=UPI00082E4FB8|nr:NUDIX domain-containing protein [Actinomadura hibisca]
MKICDNASVGVLVMNKGCALMIERGTAPAGLAPVAGHVFDDHADYADAARAEAAEELGLTLTVTDLKLARVAWRNNRCRRAPGPRGIGHHWKVFVAHVADTLVQPSPREVRSVRWMTPRELTDAAWRTLYYAQGHVTEQDWQANPGIEPVWVYFLQSLGLVGVRQAEVIPDDGLALIDACAARPLPA